MITLEDWAEIRRLHLSEGISIRQIAKNKGIARDTVAKAIKSTTPPSYKRHSSGSSFDKYEAQVCALLAEFPTMASTVLAERVGWTKSMSLFRDKVAQLRPLYKVADPTDRLHFEPGDAIQCDLWFPKVDIVIKDQNKARFPVLVMVNAYSRFISAMMLPSRKTPDLILGSWEILVQLGAIPKVHFESIM